jgi:hypothetical protein
MDTPIFMDDDSMGTAREEELRRWLNSARPGDFGE